MALVFEMFVAGVNQVIPKHLALFRPILKNRFEFGPKSPKVENF